MNINVTLVGDRELVAKFDRLPLAIQEILFRKVTQLALYLQGYIQRDKLSGQVLNVVTGALRRSIHTIPTQNNNGVITGGVASSGDVKYAAIHEFGFDGEENVKQHMRTVCFGRKVDPYLVGPFTRHMKMPERSFMRTGLADKKQYIGDELKKAVAGGVREALH